MSPVISDKRLPDSRVVHEALTQQPAASHFSKIPSLTGSQSQLNILSTLFLPLGNCSFLFIQNPTHLKECVFIYGLVSDVSDGEESACSAG